MGKRKERPDGIVFYQQSLRTLALLPDEAAGKAIKAAIAYFTTGTEMDEAQTMEYLAFSVLKVDIDSAFGRFREKCERNRQNRAGGNELSEVTSGDQSSPVVTDGDQNRDEQNLSESNYTESEQKGNEAAEPPAPARDENGLIFLSDKDYQKLEAELGSTELQRVISYLSSYCRLHGKTYPDWPFTIRKAAREGWGKPVPGKGAAKGPQGYQPSAERIQRNNDWLDAFLAEQQKKQEGANRYDNLPGITVL